MPKRTKEFRSMPDYQEAVIGKQKGCVLFGHRRDLSQYYSDIDQHQEQSIYLGRILYPESQRRKQINGGIWEYDKNKAFWAGAIDCGQTFVLVSDIAHYRASGGTVDEMFWLQDNGYSFEPNSQNPHQTMALPPQIPLANPQIKNYNNGYGDESESMQAKQQRLVAIRGSILQQRAALMAQRSIPATH